MQLLKLQLKLQRSFLKSILNPIYIYILAECEVRFASYGPSFFLPLMAQVRSARTMKTIRKKRESITCRTDRANEANKMFIIRCLYGFVDYSGFEKVVDS